MFRYDKVARSNGTGRSTHGPENILAGNSGLTHSGRRTQAEAREADAVLPLRIRTPPDAGGGASKAMGKDASAILYRQP